MTDYTEQLPASINYYGESSGTIWDNGDTLWDVSGNVAHTLWDVSTNSYTESNSDSVIWSEA